MRTGKGLAVRTDSSNAEDAEKIMNEQYECIQTTDISSRDFGTDYLVTLPYLCLVAMLVELIQSVSFHKDSLVSNSSCRETTANIKRELSKNCVI